MFSFFTSEEWMAIEPLIARESLFESLTAERDEARQLAADLWASLPTETKVQIFERSSGWVPSWVRDGTVP